MSHDSPQGGCSAENNPHNTNQGDQHVKAVTSACPVARRSDPAIATMVLLNLVPLYLTCAVLLY